MCAAAWSGTISNSAGAEHGPGSEDPRRGRTRDAGPGRADEVGAVPGAGGTRGRGTRRLPSPPRAPAVARRGGAGERSRSPRRGRPGRLPVSPRGAGRGGRPGEGEKGRGRGRGKGEPLCGVASELLPPPPRPPPPFRFTQTNKMAAVTARLFRPPKSLVQIGRMFTVKKVLVRLRSPPEPQKRWRRRADHFLVLWTTRLLAVEQAQRFLAEVFRAVELADSACAMLARGATTWV